MLFLLLLELALNDDSSTIKIFHCLHFLILVRVSLITFFETLQFGLYKDSPAADRPTHSIRSVPGNCGLPSRTFRCCSKVSWREDCKYATTRNNNIPICMQGCGHCWHQKVYNPCASNISWTVESTSSIWCLSKNHIWWERWLCYPLSLSHYSGFTYAGHWNEAPSPESLQRYDCASP